MIAAAHNADNLKVCLPHDITTTELQDWATLKLPHPDSSTLLYNANIIICIN